MKRLAWQWMSPLAVSPFPPTRLKSNGALGIDLFNQSGAGVTPNDAGDGDNGGNGLQNFPVLQSANIVTGGTVVTGTFNSLSNSQFSLEFFGNPQRPERLRRRRSFSRFSDGHNKWFGNATFQMTVARAAVGSSITATATHLATGNTSEFLLRASDPKLIGFSQLDWGN